MNGYELIAKMRRFRRKNQFTATEQALYYELVALCNEDEWNVVFSCSNYELCNALNITENTLNAARQRLIQAGLVFYKSGKSKRQFSKYSFTVDLSTTSKFAGDTATNVDTVTATNPATVVEDYYKQETKNNSLKKESAQELTKIEIGNTIEFLDRVKQKKLSADEVINFWKAFQINEREPTYLSREKEIKHFRNWLKNQENFSAKKNLNGNTNNSQIKPGISEARINAVKNWSITKSD